MTRLLAALLLLAPAACGGVDTYAVQYGPAGPPTGRRIAAFPEGKAPAQPFLEVGLLQVISRGQGSTAADLLRAMRVRAAELGCDAIARLRVDQGSTLAHAYGVCIRYADGMVRPSVPRPTPEPDGTLHM